MFVAALGILVLFRCLRHSCRAPKKGENLGSRGLEVGSAAVKDGKECDAADKEPAVSVEVES